MGDYVYEQEHSVELYSGKLRNVKKVRFVGILVGLLVCLSLAFSVGTLMFTLDRCTRLYNGTETSVCMPCCDIQRGVRNSTEVSKLYDSLERHTDQESVLQCCAKTAEQKEALTKMVLKILSKKLSPMHPPVSNADSLLASPSASELKGTFGSSLAYAQKSLQIHKSHTSNIPDTNFITLEIEPNVNYARELAEGVELCKEGIIVKHPGLYFIYKSVNFFPDSGKPCKDFARQNFESVLVRKTGDDTRDLIRSIHTCCPDCVRESETGFAGGVFQLDEGDTIQVKVTGAGIVQISRDVTFVGLMMMGGRKD